MYIQLTNANPEFRGNPVVIRRDLIVTVYATTKVMDDDTIDQVTFVFVPPHGTWEVTETFDQVMNQLNAVRS